MRRVTPLAIVTLVVSGSLGGHAASNSPACVSPAHRQCDFWVGIWDVFERGSHAKAAEARVSAELDGCVIREVYVDDHGLRGESLSSYDARAEQWQQTWVTNRGQLLVIHGRWSGSGLTFQGWIREGATETLVRATWARRVRRRARDR